MSDENFGTLKFSGVFLGDANSVEEVAFFKRLTVALSQTGWRLGPANAVNRVNPAVVPPRYPPIDLYPRGFSTVAEAHVGDHPLSKLDMAYALEDFLSSDQLIYTFTIESLE